MYSIRKTLTMLARVTRAISARLKIVSVIVGSTRWCAIQDRHPAGEIVTQRAHALRRKQIEPQRKYQDQHLTEPKRHLTYTVVEQAGLALSNLKLREALREPVRRGR